MSNTMSIEGRTIRHTLCWIRSQAQMRPDKTAIRDSDRACTYRQLDKVSDAVCRYLQSRGVGPESLVLVDMDRTLEVFYAIFGIWKARAVFSYVVKSSPQAQKQLIWEDLGKPFVFTHEQMRDIIEELRAGDAAPSVSLEHLSLDDPAWVVVTSGTSGKPKKVLILQRNIAVSMAMNAEVLKITSSDVKSMMANFSFMSAIVESLPTLICGGTVTMVPQDIRHDIRKMSAFIAQEGVTAAFLPVHCAEQFVESEYVPENFRLLTTGGDAARRLRPREGFDIALCYGMTEVAGPITYYYIKGGERGYPVGEVFPLSEMYLLDEEQNPVCGEGAVGEICFAGPTVCPGYMGEEELNEARFIENPFSHGELQDRLYRTGDMARIGGDGALYYLGRSDMLCKIRSFRIELAEVENAAGGFDGVTRCVVKPLYDEAGEKELHLFYSGPAPLDNQKLRSYLREHLLHYKVPKYYHYLASVPLSDNGKIDRRALKVEGFFENDPRAVLCAQ